MSWRICISGEDEIGLEIHTFIPINKFEIANQIVGLLRQDKDDWCVSLLESEELK